MNVIGRLVLVTLVAFEFYGCNIVCPNSQEVIAWLSNFITESEAKSVIMHEKCNPDRLAELVDKWYVGADSRWYIMTHPDFPISKRLELLRKGKGDWYIHCGLGSEEEVLAYLEGHDGWGNELPVGLEDVLKRPGLSMATYKKAHEVRWKKSQYMRQWLCARLHLNESVIRILWLGIAILIVCIIRISYKCRQSDKKDNQQHPAKETP